MPRVVVDIFTGNLLVLPNENVKSIVLESWNNAIADMGGGAPEDIEFNQKVHKFSIGLNQALRARVKVPSDYINGRLLLNLTFYTPSIAGSFFMKAITYLDLLDTLDVGSIVNSYPSTNVKVDNIAPSNCLRKISFDLTDLASKINGVAVTANSILDIILYRDVVAGDDVADIRMIPHAEITKG